MANTAVIDFIFNTHGAMKAIGEFQNKLSRSVDAITKSTASKLGGLGTTLIGFSSVKSMFSELEKFSDFSTMYDKPVQELSRFNNVMAQFGGSTEDVLHTLGNMEDALVELRTNASGAYKQLATRLKIDFFDSKTGKFKDSITILKQIRGEWHKLSDSAKQDVLNKLGLRLPAVKRYLDANNAEMKEALDAAAKMPEFTNKNLNSLKRVKRSLSVIRSSFIQLGAVILEAFEKPIEKFAKAAEWLSQQNEGVRGSILGIVSALGLISPILTTLKFLLKPFAPLLSLIGIVGRAAFVGILRPLSFVVTLIEVLGRVLVGNSIGLFLAAIAAAGYLVYKNWDRIKAYFSQFVNWLSTQAERMTGVFERLFHNLVEWIKNILGKIPVIGKMINDELKDQEADVELKTGYDKSVLNKAPAEMPMIPRGAMLSGGTTTNNNQRSNVSNTYNVTFNGVSNADEINNKFTQVVRQGTTGVR